MLSCPMMKQTTEVISFGKPDEHQESMNSMLEKEEIYLLVI